MRVYGVIGWKNAGKTGLMERLVADITGRGFTVSTIKHVHHDVDLDQPGKDSFRHRAAGATEVVLASAHRFALMREHRGPEPELPEVLARLAPVDLVLVEGYKRDAHPKVEVWRPVTGHPMIQPGDPLVRAIATDAPPPFPPPVPVLDLNDTREVADFILRETGLIRPAPFDTVVVVDWSAASAPTPPGAAADAIWFGIARAGQPVQTQTHRTRRAAETALAALLDDEDRAGRRVLLGFDFPMGYPAGTAARLTGQPDPRALWRLFESGLTDDDRNRNDRFALAARLNATFGATGPFWGRPAGRNLPGLPVTKPDYFALGLAERRQVETLVPRAQPVWKLYTTGSVGSQSLTGLPVVSRLSRRPGARVWPFDDCAAAPLVIAEIYPSLLAAEVTAAGDAVKDRAQVTLLSRALLALARSGRLDPLLAVPDIAREEGWILGAGHVPALRAALAPCA